MSDRIAGGKPKLTLDEFFNSVGFSALELAPDGNPILIGTARADWDQRIFRKYLWLNHGKIRVGEELKWLQKLWRRAGRLELRAVVGSEW